MKNYIWITMSRSGRGASGWTKRNLNVAVEHVLYQAEEGRLYHYGPSLPRPNEWMTRRELFALRDSLANGVTND